MRARQIVLWKQPLFICGSYITVGALFRYIVYLQNLFFCQISMCLYVREFEYCLTEKIWVWPKFSPSVVRVSHPRQVSQYKDLIHVQRKIGMSGDHSDIWIIRPSTICRPWKTAPVIDSDRVI